ncbi:hypothetical protein CHLRE_07g333100v5 [Chlamydomonas reinhardtii]|uniref:Hydroxyproline-rich glycoprotein n=1 Tax=Chlamydomonas reinhardtii TaxID=3055 RepID=A8IGP0_CHLRE|nr:uncharacterized protein CHLRE_07g333100v5 [Chlamydomonas reinhardtii]XP_042922789.1 uncharacterized protein CHLRE_07g333100v5 [Chlamydomonas reinhardtii]PNW80872.1 hypothetical protein CHLRE_07g333100v5 [Chlamydomonas reinhardtii]PNW80873.1 hypothetical protein CHLRE_07g333100v5 [Chlamydomonas reinhardtii]|eukprot:XP_001690600.1 predicted protein [Chlamydomonas reinhardtii]
MAARTFSTVAAWSALLLILAATCGVQARPQYWADPVWRLVPELPPCTAHPERNYAELYAPHGAPIPDSTVVFTLYGTDNTTVTSAVCPGETHVLQVSFPQRRLALLTASRGAIVPHAGSISRVLDPNCPQRVDLGDSYYLNNSFKVDYTLPCNATDAQAILFKVTSAPGAQQWRQGNVTIIVDPACAAVACDFRGGNASPSPRPPTSVPRGSPPPPSYGYGGYGNYGGYGGYGGYGHGGYGGYGHGGYGYGGYGYGGYGHGGYGYGGYGYGGYGYGGYGYV